MLQAPGNVIEVTDVVNKALKSGKQKNNTTTKLIHKLNSNRNTTTLTMLLI